METKPFSVTLDKGNVARAKELIKKDGGKLSPILNNLLEEWLKEKEAELVKKEEGENEK